MEPIPWDDALRICGEIREVKARRLFTQCWGCVKASKGDPQRMCFANRGDHRGCGLVNRAFDARGAPGPAR